jgi:hypothetical protein
LLTGLKVLRLANNSITGNLLNVSAMNSLHFLDLATNQLSGELPEYIFELNNLQFMNLADNAFTGLIFYSYYLNFLRVLA